MYKKIITDLMEYKNPQKAKQMAKFFQAFEGGYGYGDKFLGIVNPDIRKIVKKYKNSVGLDDIERMIKSSYHEERLLSLLFLVELFSKAEDKKGLVDFYLDNATYINNWDLVDSSVYKILGQYCLDNDDYEILFKLSDTGQLWKERMSIVANWIIVKNGKFEILLTLSRKFLSHKHDLMHKAVGWILREMGKSSTDGYKALLNFLDENANVMPRTMLRYSLEKLPIELKNKYMRK